MFIRRFRWYRLGSLTLFSEFFYGNFIIIVIIITEVQENGF
jgi:hypothetical protein